MRCIQIILVLIAAFLPGFGLATNPAPAAETLALAGGTIIDVSNFGRSTSDIKDSVIIIQQGRIIAAGCKRIKIPANAKVLDDNPATDVRNAKKIHAIILNGKLLDREKLLSK